VRWVALVVLAVAVAGVAAVAVRRRVKAERCLYIVINVRPGPAQEA